MPDSLQTANSYTINNTGLFNISEAGYVNHQYRPGGANSASGVGFSAAQPGLVRPDLIHGAAAMANINPHEYALQNSCNSFNGNSAATIITQSQVRSREEMLQQSNGSKRPRIDQMQQSLANANNSTNNNNDSVIRNSENNNNTSISSSNNKGNCSGRSKEKLGERISALQQLVSPFGKTDTASVLSEAIGYIKFLQEQVQVLSSPYMKPCSSQQLSLGKKQDAAQMMNQSTSNTASSSLDLRSRGLCLVPVSCTLHVANNNNGADYWASSASSSINHTIHNRVHSEMASNHR